MEAGDASLPDEQFIRMHYPDPYGHRREPAKEEFASKRCGSLRLSVAVNLSLIRSFLSLFDLSSLFLVALGAAVTYLCYKYELLVDLPLSLLSVGVIFPLSFNLEYSNERRERALLDIASLKASIIALFQLNREWSKNLHRSYSEEFFVISRLLVEDIVAYISHRGGKARLFRIYKSFDRMSKLLEDLRCEDDWIRSAITRAYQYLRFMMVDFERLRVIHDFRTASTLRAYSSCFLSFFPLIFAPYFAHLSHEYGFWSGMYVSVVSSAMIAALSRIRDGLEDPFDQVGLDDINLQVLGEVQYHMFPPTESDERPS
jgi:hypothetical protein